MSRQKDMVVEARKAAALLHAHSGKRELLTPEQRRAAYRVAMACQLHKRDQRRFLAKSRVINDSLRLRS